LHAEFLRLQAYTQNLERFSTPTVVTSTRQTVTILCTLPALLFLELRTFHTVTVVYSFFFHTHKLLTLILVLIHYEQLLYNDSFSQHEILGFLFCFPVTSHQTVVILILPSNSHLISKTHLLLLAYLHEGTITFRNVDNCLPVDSSYKSRKPKYKL
jgi:hypothetical protein